MTFTVSVSTLKRLTTLVKHSENYSASQGDSYQYRTCTFSKEGDPYRAPDSKSEYALRIPLEMAFSITEIRIDFNVHHGQIAELDFEFLQ